MRLPASLLALLAIVFAVASAAAPAGADTPPGTIIVLDGSGSMGGPLEGQTVVKFDMAREAIRAATGKVSATAPLGLMMFGHRRRGNCGDIELANPPAPGSAAAIMARLDHSGTVGKGPITQALKEAAKSFPPGTPGALVLIHDDADNCRQDACAVADELAKSNPGVAIHVISLSLDPLVPAAMSCLATKTGGKSFVAHDATELGRELMEAMTLAKAIPPDEAPRPVSPAPEAAKPAEPPAATDGPPRIRLTAALSAASHPIVEPVGWKIMTATEPAEVKIDTAQAVLSEPLAPGKYIVEARLGLASQRTEIEVADKGETAKAISLDAGLLKVEARTSKTAETLVTPLLSIHALSPGRKSSGAQGDAVWLGRKSNLSLVLPAGQYVVAMADGETVKEAPVEIKAGADTAAEFIMGTGRLELSVAAVEGGEALDGTTTVIEADDPEAPQGRREVARSASPSPSFLLPAGTYYVTAMLGPASIKERIAIGTGDVVKRVLVLGAGTLVLSAQFDPAIAPPDTAVSYRILRQTGASLSEVAHASTSSATLTLPAGHYQIEAHLGALPLRTSAAADITAGGTAKALLKFEAAELAVKSPAVSSEPTRWSVRNASGHVVLRSDGGEQRAAFLSPGRYTLATEAGEARHEIPLELKAGDRRSIDATAPGP